MTGLEYIALGLSLASAIASTTVSLVNASKPVPKAPTLDEGLSAQKHRRAAIKRAQTAYGLTQTRVAGNDTVVGASLARGQTIVGAVQPASEGY